MRIVLIVMALACLAHADKPSPSKSHVPSTTKNEAPKKTVKSATPTKFQTIPVKSATPTKFQTIPVPYKPAVPAPSKTPAFQTVTVVPHHRVPPPFPYGFSKFFNPAPKQKYVPVLRTRPQHPERQAYQAAHPSRPAPRRDFRQVGQAAVEIPRKVVPGKAYPKVVARKDFPVHSPAFIHKPAHISPAHQPRSSPAFPRNSPFDEQPPFNTFFKQLRSFNPDQIFGKPSFPGKNIALPQRRAQASRRKFPRNPNTPKIAYAKAEDMPGWEKFTLSEVIRPEAEKRQDIKAEEVIKYVDAPNNEIKEIQDGDVSIKLKISDFNVRRR